ncbi:MAG: glycosyltransferase [Micrococcales bacterium]|nr:glycosyltransferase [Micrococcales bacterium]
MDLKLTVCAVRSNPSIAAPSTVAGLPCQVASCEQATDQWLVELAAGSEALVAIALDPPALCRLRQAQPRLAAPLIVLTVGYAEAVIRLLRDGLAADQIAYPVLFSPGRLLANEARDGQRWRLNLVEGVDHSAGGFISSDPEVSTGSSVPSGLGIKLGVDEVSVNTSGLQPLELAALQRRRGLLVDGRHRLLIGPTNRAGLANGWAQAVLNHLPGVAAQSIAIRTAKSARRIFLADVAVDRLAWDLPVTRVDIALDLLAPASHVLMEEMQPLLGGVGLAGRGGTESDELVAQGAAMEAQMIMDSGRKVGVVLHGGLEDPPSQAAIAALEQLDRGAVPVFVSRPEVVGLVPGAIWLPMALAGLDLVPASSFAPASQLKVAYVPPGKRPGAGQNLSPTMAALAEAGVMEYRPLDGYAPVGLPHLLRGVDVVVDQLSQPGLSPLALQALAAGCLVISHLPPAVGGWYLEPPPVLKADPDHLVDQLLNVARCPTDYQALAEAGPAWVRRHHDGQLAVKVLERHFLGDAK